MGIEDRRFINLSFRNWLRALAMHHEEPEGKKGFSILLNNEMLAAAKVENYELAKKIKDLINLESNTLLSEMERRKLRAELLTFEQRNPSTT